MNGTTSGWKLVTSGVPQGSIQEPVLLNILINYQDAGDERTTSLLTMLNWRETLVCRTSEFLNTLRKPWQEPFMHGNKDE